MVYLSTSGEGYIIYLKVLLLLHQFGDWSIGSSKVNNPHPTGWAESFKTYEIPTKTPNPYESISNMEPRGYPRGQE